MSGVKAPHSVSSQKAPGAIGPYSQGVVAGNLLFISGQLPVDPATGAFVAGGIAEHAHQCLKNLSAIATAAGTSLERAVKVTVFLADMGNFATVNQVYGEYFKSKITRLHDRASGTQGPSLNCARKSSALPD
jgi:2-iminobutanoate/2-iminopropanoate deaminase